jgi:hypothetical protein
MQRVMTDAAEVVNPGTHWRNPSEHGNGIAGSRREVRQTPRGAVEIITPAHVEVQRAPVHPGRFEPDAGAFGAGFAAVGAGRDVTTGKGWK